MKRSLRILLVDDRLLVRAGLRALLERSRALTVVGEARNTAEMLKLARTRKPDVVLMDAELSDGEGFAAATQLHREQRPPIPVILLSLQSNGHRATAAMRASASGYLLMSSRPKELERAILSVAKGRRYIDHSIAQKMIATALRTPHGHDAESPPLTPRQRQTLEQIVEGKNTKEVAAALGVSSKTIDFHRMQLMKKLSSHSIAGLVRRAIQLGLVKIRVSAKTP